MIYKISASERHFTNAGWLQSYWLFSFGDYYDPKNMEFGSLRVFNDDRVAPKMGFPNHPHDTMEIVTIVLEGELTHSDSMGNTGSIKSGDVQRMSAGGGIEHSEMNNGDTPVHLYQLWFYPKNNTQSGYEQKNIPIKKNEITLLASDNGREGSLVFNVNATLERLALEKDHSLSYKIEEGKRLFIYVGKGKISLVNDVFNEGDQARITDESNVHISALEESDLILINV